jgi:hypothetical protein
VKDLLVCEFVRQGRLTVDDVERMAKDAKNIVIPIYNLLLRTGILLSVEDWEAKGDAFVRATSAAAEETERVDAEKRLLRTSTRGGSRTSRRHSSCTGRGGRPRAGHPPRPRATTRSR